MRNTVIIEMAEGEDKAAALRRCIGRETDPEVLATLEEALSKFEHDAETEVVREEVRDADRDAETSASVGITLDAVATLDEACNTGDLAEIRLVCMAHLKSVPHDVFTRVAKVAIREDSCTSESYRAAGKLFLATLSAPGCEVAMGFSEVREQAVCVIDSPSAAWKEIARAIRYEVINTGLDRISEINKKHVKPTDSDT